MFLGVLSVIAVVFYYSGYNQGEKDGIEEAQSEEYSRGYSEGFRKGRTIGYFKEIDRLYYETLEGLYIKTLPPVRYDEIFSRKHVLRADINTFDEFYRFARERYEAHAEMLRERWKIEDNKKDNKKLEAIFYMNFVSGMWGFGNPVRRSKKGCVRSNEENGWQLVPVDEVTVQTYIQSSIGCCTDSAYLLSYLLKRANIRQRLIKFPGHVLNEVRIGEQWYTLDAFSNIMFHASWSDIRNPEKKPSKLTVTVFPHHNLLAGENPHYREKIGHFRICLLLKAAYGATGKVTYPKLPQFFKDTFHSQINN